MPKSRKERNQYTANRKIIDDYKGYFTVRGKPTNIIYHPLKSENPKLFDDQVTTKKFGLKFKSLLNQTMDKLFDKKYDHNDYSPIPNYQWFADLADDNFFVFHIVTKGEYKGKVVYYYALIVEPCDEDGQQTEGANTLVEVIQDCNKVSENYFYETVEKALKKVKLDNPKRIKVTASATELRPFSYKGKIITAGTKQEAIAKIVAGAENNFVTRLKKLGFHTSCCIDNCDGLDYGLSDNVSVYFKNKYADADISIRTGEDDYKYFKNIPSEKVVDWCEKNHNLLDAYEKWGKPEVAEKMKVSLSKIK